MEKRKFTNLLFASFFFIGVFQNIQAQFFKKLKQSVENRIAEKADKEIDGMFKYNHTEKPKKENETVHINGQQENTSIAPKKPAEEVAQSSDTDVITYKAPSADFVDIIIQSHKGLPRYGDLHYRLGVTTPVNNEGYKKLVELKFLRETYDDMNLAKLTSYEEKSSGDQRQGNSYFAQSHLKNLAGQVCSEEVLKTYFCDETANASNTNTKSKYQSSRQIPCEFSDSYKIRKVPSHWGGSRNNEFQQQRSYKGFSEKYLRTLQSWADTFFGNGEQVAYLVNTTNINGKYDFKNKGFWLTGLIRSSGFMLHPSNFLAYSENEKKIKNSHQQFFFSIDPQKAKEFNLQERVPLNCVFKVKVFPKVVNHTQVQFDFELVDPIIEIYSKNEALTEKLGEIDIENLQSKQ
ncbi:hypothetical protein [Flagellimonas flava]|uniref:hypothetical protein n=1 Tax=Flagellimonas flava TaxID=570519 RepID=UPI003D652B1A